MKTLVETANRLAHDETGSTSIEYALIGTLISVAIIGGAIALGDQLGVTYTDLSKKFSGK